MIALDHDVDAEAQHLQFIPDGRSSSDVEDQEGPWQLVLGSIPDAPSSGLETASEAMVKVGDIPDASSGDSESPSAMPDVEGAAEVSDYRDLQLMPISPGKDMTLNLVTSACRIADKDLDPEALFVNALLVNENRHTVTTTAHARALRMDRTSRTACPSRFHITPVGAKIGATT